MLLWLERIVTVVAVLMAVEVGFFCVFGGGSALSLTEKKILAERIKTTEGHGRDALARKLKERGWDEWLARDRSQLASPRPSRSGTAGGAEGGVSRKAASGKRGKAVAKDGDEEGRDLDQTAQVSGFDIKDMTDDWEIRTFPAKYKDAVVPDMRAGIDQLGQAGSRVIDLDDGTTAIEITGINPGSAIEAGGFQSGDVLISVNGHRVTGAQDGMKLFPLLKDETKFWVEIIRDGRRKTLIYDLE